MRNIHYSRLLDIISGSAFAGAKTKIQKSAIYRDFDTTKLNSLRFRQVLTANLPVFYVVDCSLIAKEIVNSIYAKPGRYIEKIVTSGGLSAPEDKDFSIGIPPNILIPELTREILNSVSKIRKSSFESTLAALDKVYTNTLSTISSSNKYTKIRNAAIKLGYEVRIELNKLGTFIATDASKFINNNLTNSVVVVSPTFDRATSDINKLILDDLTKYFRDKYGIYVTTNNTGFKIGNFINAGHTSAVTESGDSIGINMPSAQELQFRASNTALASKIDTELSKLYADIDYSIVFKQGYSSKAKNLLEMQFAFAITMPAEFNTGKLRVDEQQRLKALIGSEILPTLEEQLKKKFASVLDPTIISASPSFNDYVESLVGNALDSKIKLKTTNKTSKSKSSTKLLIPTNVLVKGKPLIGKSKSASIKTKLPLSRKDPGVDLLSITNIIRLGLKQKIIDNMGTGSSRSVLNYRTGRFADSAELIKLTQGKQGFISAYYTYMKYPYATFSEGGKQQYPRSRDPKKLISKSIRELVSEAVSKRMRTVLV